MHQSALVPYKKQLVIGTRCPVLSDLIPSTRAPFLGLGSTSKPWTVRWCNSRWPRFFVNEWYHYLHHCVLTLSFTTPYPNLDSVSAAVFIVTVFKAGIGAPNVVSLSYCWGGDATGWHFPLFLLSRTVPKSEMAECAFARLLSSFFINCSSKFAIALNVLLGVSRCPR